MWQSSYLSKIPTYDVASKGRRNVATARKNFYDVLRCILKFAVMAWVTERLQYKVDLTNLNQNENFSSD